MAEKGRLGANKIAYRKEGEEPQYSPFGHAITSQTIIRTRDVVLRGGIILGEGPLRGKHDKAEKWPKKVEWKRGRGGQG